MDLTPLTTLLLLTFLISTAAGLPTPQDSSSRNTLRDVNWSSDAQKTLRESLNSVRSERTAKNVILFIGDGMGVSTVTAARVLKAQKEKKNLHETRLAWEEFPHTSMAITYNIDQITPDSAGTATAFLTGTKTNAGLIGVDQRVRRGNCGTLTEAAKLKSLLKHSHEQGKWTGIVTTTRITHATPASAYAHSPERGWEADSDIRSGERACRDIAKQLVEDNDFIRVVLGGGRRNLLGTNDTDPEYPTKRGLRSDGVNLMKRWEEKQGSKANVGPGKVKVVTDQSGFDAIDPDQTEYMMGLFEPGHMNYELERSNEPSLEEMTEKAIKLLERSDRGFFLLVEGGRIDLAHHANKAHKALTETIALSEAVQKAVDLTDKEDTLIVTTADHSHVFTLGGYPHPNTDILGLSRKVKYGAEDETELQLADDGLPWLPLSYGNGKGFIYHRTNGSVDGMLKGRRNLTQDDATNATSDANYRQDAAFPLAMETHGGEDVAVYAAGPMAHLLHGSYEQSYIAHVMMYASCVGPNKDHCVTSGAGREKPRHVLMVAFILGIWQIFR